MEPVEGTTLEELAGDVTATPEVEPTEPTNPEPEETLGVLSEDTPEPQESESKDDLPDMSTPEDFDKHPVLKAKYEARIAEVQKGVQKFIGKHKEEITELSKWRDENQPLVDFYHRLNDPDDAMKAYKELGEKLQAFYGRPFVTQSNIDTSNEEELFASESIAETKARWFGEIRNELKSEIAELKKMLEPVQTHYKTESEQRQASEKAESALTTLKQRYEVSADPWITKDKVMEAMREYPGLDGIAAFRAKFADDLVRYGAKHNRGQTVRDMPDARKMSPSIEDAKEGSSLLSLIELTA